MENDLKIIHQCVNCPVKGCVLSLTFTKNPKLLEQCPCGLCIVNTMCIEVCDNRMEFTKKVFIKNDKIITLSDIKRVVVMAGEDNYDDR